MRIIKDVYDRVIKINNLKEEEINNEKFEDYLKETIDLRVILQNSSIIQ